MTRTCLGPMIMAVLLSSAVILAAEPPKLDAPAFWIELLDGRFLTGKAVFEARLITPYGEVTIPSSALCVITRHPENLTATVETDDLLATGKLLLNELALTMDHDVLKLPIDKVARLERVYPSTLGEGWSSLLAGHHLKAWKGPALPLGKDGVLRMTTPVNTWGAEYEGKLPPRYELSLEVKFAAGARTDLHVASENGTAYVRVSDLAADKPDQWVTVRFVRDNGLKAFVNDEEVQLGLWREQGSPTIALSSDFAESQSRNITLRPR